MGMRLVDLNTWGGKLYDRLSLFLERSAKTTDIFCLQEVFDNSDGSAIDAWEGAVPDLYAKLRETLEGFSGYLGGTYTSFGERLAIFVSNRLEVIGDGEIELCRKRPTTYKGRTDQIGSRLRWVELEGREGGLTVANIHGLWTPYDKDDNEDRIIQSERIIRFLDGREGRKILCGDFNVTMDTNSIRMLEEELKNLIKEYNIKTTRNRLAHPLAGSFCDYVFVSGDVEVRGFEAVQEEVSDHLALMVEFE